MEAILMNLKTKWDMIIIARLYIEKPEDEFFEKMNPATLEKVIILAKEIQKKIDKGEMA
jgi:hypothetical protein